MSEAASHPRSRALIVSTGEGISIRDAHVDDAPALSALVAQLGYPTPPAVVRERLLGLSTIGGRALVAEREGRVVGLATMQQTRSLHRVPDARLTSLVVDEAERGAGLGRLLLAEVERWAVREGCGRLELTSGFARAGAHAFYEHLGYETQSKRFVKSLAAPHLGELPSSATGGT
jgi:GNAT superfamily N-acetyltransferase